MEKQIVLDLLMHTLVTSSRGWTYRKDIVDAVGEDKADNIINELLGEKVIKYCGCDCGGIILTQKGIDEAKPYKEKPMVWKTKEGNLVRLTHMSDEHLMNAMVFLLTDSTPKDTCENVPITTWLKAMANELEKRAS